MQRESWSGLLWAGWRHRDGAREVTCPLTGRCYAGGLEFSYKLSEAEYRAARKLRKNGSTRAVPRIIFFWIFILICLMLFWAVVSRPAHPPVEKHHPVVTQNQETQPATIASSPVSIAAILPGQLNCAIAPHRWWRQERG
jgi:hypothetical protein